MPKYKVTAYPNWDSWTMEIEADTPEEAQTEGEEEARMNCFFGVDIKDVEVIE